MDDHSDPQAAASRAPAEKPDPPRHRWLRRIGRWLLLFVLIPYLAIVALFAMMQRSLIYQGTRLEVIHLEEAGFPEGQAHDVAIKAHDGLTLRGWHVFPSGQIAADDSERRRHLAQASWVLLAFPGNAGSRIDRGFELRDFADLGMHVFLFDYRGYGDNPGSPSEESIAADARAVWKYLIQECGIEHRRIIIFGESLGGGVATRLAADVCEAGQPPAALVLNSTFSSLADAAAWHYPFLPARLLLFDRFDSQSRIANVSCPTVLIHGTDDDIVPIQLGRKLFDAAPPESAGGIQKRFIEVPHGRHNDIPRSQLQESLRRLMDAAPKQ